MKKLIFAAFAAGAMVLAGCTKVEVKDVPENRAIGFDNFVSNSVKSIDNKEDLTNFYVYGGTVADQDIFNNQQVDVAWQGGSATVSYEPKRFWAEKTAYKFAAYSNENTQLTNVTLNTFAEDANFAHLMISNYTTDGKNDLVYAQSGKASYTYDGTGTPEVVQFTFYHILSNISFVFTKGEELDGITVGIENLKFNSIKTSGTFTGQDISTSQYAFDAWDTESATSGEQNITFVAKTTAEDGGKITSTPVYLVPQSAASLKISFTLTTNSGEVVTGLPASKDFTDITLAAPTGTNWEPGHSYIYVADITAETFHSKTIEFNVVDVADWELPENVNIEEEINAGAINQ